jgi:DNA topoisomerase VI subunit B
LSFDRSCRLEKFLASVVHRGLGGAGYPSNGTRQARSNMMGDGHPFIVEAAVSLGGKDAKEGITVVRFANRNPLLFEGGDGEFILLINF